MAARKRLLKVLSLYPGKKERTMLGTILIVFLILALVGALPRWSHSREGGYAPTGGVGLALVVVVLLLLLGRLWRCRSNCSRRFSPRMLRTSPHGIANLYLRRGAACQPTRLLLLPFRPVSEILEQ